MPCDQRMADPRRRWLALDRSARPAENRRPTRPHACTGRIGNVICPVDLCEACMADAVGIRVHPAAPGHV